MLQFYLPDPARNLQLADVLLTVFSSLPAVQRVLIFGSLARGDADQFSDLDMLVVTANRAQFSDVFTQLAQQKPILYRSTFSHEVEPCGGRVLGIVFEGESVFHNLDLNFLTAEEYNAEGALDRFGITKQLYAADGHPDHNDSIASLASEVEPPEEKRVADGLHFTKKFSKRILRGEMLYPDLHKWSGYLRSALDDYPLDTQAPRGNIRLVAETYLKIANSLLSTPSAKQNQVTG